MRKTTQKICPVAALDFYFFIFLFIIIIIIIIFFCLRTYELSKNGVSFERLFLPCSVKVGICGSDN
jgi:hypothetical protein